MANPIFKLASLVYNYKVLNTGHPPYLTELLQYHKSARSTRSSASHTYFLFRDTTIHLALAFSQRAPKIWNSVVVRSVNPKHTLLSDVILRCTTFTQPILPPRGPRIPVMRPDSLLMICRIQLLTSNTFDTTWKHICWLDISECNVSALRVFYVFALYKNRQLGPTYFVTS